MTTVALVAPSGPDFSVTYHGNVYLLNPLSEGAREWIEQFVDYEPWQRFGRALVVDQHYIADLVAGMANDGLVQS